jgi:hypothetical protein
MAYLPVVTDVPTSDSQVQRAGGEAVDRPQSALQAMEVSLNGLIEGIKMTIMTPITEPRRSEK